MKKLCMLLITSVVCKCIQAQNIGINTTSPDSSAALEVYAANKGFLMPRVTTAQMNAISNPATGLEVYNTDSTSFCVYTGSAWVKVIVSTGLNNYFTADGNNIYSSNTGNVGIGTSSPSNKLEVKGTAAADSINTSYFKMSNGAANGYILQSDSAGNAGWVSSSSITGNTSSLTGSYIPKWNDSSFGNSKLYDDGNSISIGTTNTDMGGPLGYSLFTVASEDSYRSDFNMVKASDDGFCSWQNSAKARGSLNALSAVKDGDQLYVLDISGYDGNNFADAAFISSSVDGTPSSGIIPGNLVFYTTSSSGNNDSRMVINSEGNIGIGTSSPKSTLDVTGSVGLTVKAITTGNNSTTLGSTDYMVVYSGSVSGNSITLPAAGSYAGRVYIIVNHSSNSVSVSAYYTSNTGTATTVSAGSTAQLVSDGTNWHKIN